MGKETETQIQEVETATLMVLIMKVTTMVQKMETRTTEI